MAEGEQKKKGIGEILAGSLLLKILLLVGALLIVSIVIFGMPFTPQDILINAIKFGVGIFLIWLAIKGVQSLFFKTVFSPTESFKEKITEIAELTKPFNVEELWLRGEDMRMGSKIGSITGIAFLPYLSSVPETEPGEDGREKIIYVAAKNILGQTVKDPRTGEIIKIPKMRSLTDKDGDWLFVVKQGFWVFGKKYLVRAAPRFTSEIARVIYLKTVNLMPCGDYFYPNQQYQKDILQIEAQQKTEAFIETHAHFMDLMASVAQAALNANPEIQRENYQKSEQLAAQNSGFLVGGGQQR